MAEDLVRSNGTKEEQYQALIPQIKALIDYESDFVANMANLAAALKEQFNFFWVGFYLVKENELVLGHSNFPFPKFQTFECSAKDVIQCS